MSLIATEPSPARPWPADRVEHWPIERLIVYANNPRLHSEADLDKLAASFCRSATLSSATSSGFRNGAIFIMVDNKPFSREMKSPRLGFIRRRVCCPMPAA
jgi:hypothetical protein